MSQDAAGLAVLPLVFLEGPAQDDTGLFARRFGGLTDVDVAAQTQLAAVGDPARAGRALLAGVPQVGDETIGQIGHGNPALLPGHADGLGVGRRCGHADGRVGILVGLEVQAAPQLGHLFRRVNLVVLALVAELAAVGVFPQAEDDFQRLSAHLAHVVHAVVFHAVQLQVGGQRAQADAPVETAAGHVVQHGDAVGGVHRVMQGEHGHARRQDYVLGQGQGLGDDQLGHRGVLPSFGDVLANPSLTHAEPVGLHDQLDVAVVRIRGRPARGMQRHHKQSEFH